MSHHSSRDDDAINKALNASHEQFLKELKENYPEAKSMADALEKYRLGPTGAYPDGKLTPNDEGELNMAVGRFDGRIIMSFGRAINWVGLEAYQALELATSLIDSAAKTGKLTAPEIMGIHRQLDRIFDDAAGKLLKQADPSKEPS